MMWAGEFVHIVRLVALLDNCHDQLKTLGFNDMSNFDGTDEPAHRLVLDALAEFNGTFGCSRKRLWSNTFGLVFLFLSIATLLGILCYCSVSTALEWHLTSSVETNRSRPRSCDG
jgi:hypothetical protein